MLTEPFTGIGGEFVVVVVFISQGCCPARWYLKHVLRLIKSDLARLAYVMTFDHPHARSFHLRHPHVSCGCRGSNLQHGLM